MSPLTKLFVVLLVLVSIILTAGVVTFVNKLEPIQTKLKNAQADAAAKAAQLEGANSRIVVLEKQRGDAVAASVNMAKELNGQILTVRAQVEDRETQIASSKQTITTLTSANAAQSAALSASEEAKGKLQEQVVALRKDSDERLRQNADLNQRVTTLTAENAVLEQQRRNLAEQVTELQGNSEKLSKLVSDLGGRPESIANITPGTKMGAPAINGVIRSRRTIAGKEYATISLGSQDQVIKGMEFKIIDKESGAFLGLITIDVVDANEAMGQIVADPTNLAQIKAGNVVKTQI